MLANSLALGCDCLGTIRYFDAHMADSRGELMTIKNAVCLHEEDFGILWKHTDWRTNQTEVRRARAAGCFVRRHRGELRVRLLLVLLPGRHDPAGGQAHRHHEHDGPEARRDSRGTGRKSRRSSMPRYHQHYFCARLDLTVDGEQHGPGSQHAERAARARKPARQRFIAEVDAVPGASRRPSARLSFARGSLLADRQPRPDATAWASRSAIAWSRAKLVCRSPTAERRRAEAGRLPDTAPVGHAFDPASDFPAGDYPNQNPGGDGLPRWTRPIAPSTTTGRGLVHVRAPPHSPAGGLAGDAGLGYRLLLKPDGFFDGNPAFDVPPEAI